MAIIFPIIIVLSLVLYVYYKVAILKTKDTLTQKYFNGKARLSLGVLIFFFGINQYLFYETRLSLFVGIVFLIIGGLQIRLGFNEARHYRKEWKRLNPET